jgi:hypothetical protein
MNAEPTTVGQPSPLDECRPPGQPYDRQRTLDCFRRKVEVAYVGLSYRGEKHYCDAIPNAEIQLECKMEEIKNYFRTTCGRIKDLKLQAVTKEMQNCVFGTEGMSTVTMYNFLNRPNCDEIEDPNKRRQCSIELEALLKEMARPLPPLGD